MDAVLTLLAVVGVAALLFRLLGAVLRLLGNAVRATAASEMAEVSARRGDLSTLAERREVEHTARMARRRALLLAVVLFALLVVPPLIGWTREVYAAAALLWFLPGFSVRRGH